MRLIEQYCKKCKKKTVHCVYGDIKICGACFHPIEEMFENKKEQSGPYISKEKKDY